MVQEYGGGTITERVHLEDEGGDRRIILKWNVRKWGGKTYWIALTQNSDRWQARVNAVINVRVS